MTVIEAAELAHEVDTWWAQQRASRGRRLARAGATPDMVATILDDDDFRARDLAREDELEEVE